MIAFRIQMGITTARKRVRVDLQDPLVDAGPEIFAVSGRGVGQAGQLIHKVLHAKGIRPSLVREIYSELAPCNMPGGYGQRMIANIYPNARVTGSFIYGDHETSFWKAMNAAGIDDLKTALTGHLRRLIRDGGRELAHPAP